MKLFLIFHLPNERSISAAYSLLFACFFLSTHFFVAVHKIEGNQLFNRPFPIVIHHHCHQSVTTIGTGR